MQYKNNEQYNILNHYRFTGELLLHPNIINKILETNLISVDIVNFHKIEKIINMLLEVTTLEESLRLTNLLDTNSFNLQKRYDISSKLYHNFLIDILPILVSELKIKFKYEIIDTTPVDYIMD